LTPVALLDEHTVDAVRYWSGRARLGTDTAFDEAMLKIGKRLATKIFNASRFVFMQIDRVQAEGDAVSGLEHVREPLDLALVARLRRVVEEATRSFEVFEYAPALQATEGAFWEFCDHYLELVKVRSYAEEKTLARDSAIATLQFAISVFLRLFAPFMAYVTEEVWSWRLAGEGRLRSIHTSPWPSEKEFAATELTADDEAFLLVVEVLSKIRRAKSEAKKTLKWPVASLEVGGSEKDWQRLQPVLPDILASGRVEAENVRYDASLEAEEERVPVRVTLGEE
jgi:valyl-tRNA synthetase